MRRILLMPASYVPVLGGLQTAAHAVAVNLRKLGHDVRVVTNRYPRALPAAETVDGVPVERWPLFTPRWAQVRGGRPDVFLAGLYYHPVVRARLDRLLRAFQPDVANVHFPDAQIPFVLRARDRHRFRLVVSLHGHDVERFTDPDQRGAGGHYRDDGLRALLRTADAVTACSGHLLAQACRLDDSVAAKGVAIENGIDPARFADPTPYRHDRPYILGLGRQTRKKGFDLLLEALAAAGPAAAGVDLLLAGDGEEAGALRDDARRLGLTDRVRFLGRVAPDEVIRLLNGCRALAVPSRAEPFGIVALEGLAAGRPVLATRVGGMGPFLAGVAERLRAAGLTDGGLVRLVEPDAAGLAAGLRAALADPGGRDGGAAGRFVRDYFSWVSVARAYERVLSA